ncbi:Hint domain-containing protein [Acidisoma silvae]|uniref:Hint domain-containing protein n=1 Tax=Acidisoma silvae TaxID=2802396 RepID=A0A964DY01_9PROT|nr:Hint domain-containing protein [Acidisoma silvae]MCB8874248.1 Hint domain-containing protein [Acidisoma silvae]
MTTSSGVNLDLSLTQAFLDEGVLKSVGGTSGQDVYAYAVLFENPTAANPTGFVSETTLVSDGEIGSGASAGADGSLAADIALVSNGDTLDGGKLYLVFESGSTVVTDGTTTLDQALQNQAFINSTNASTYDFSYDSIEMTLDGTSTDAANLTSVNGFSLPMSLAVDGTTNSVSYKVPATTLASTIVTNANAGSTDVKQTFTTGGLSGALRSVTSPTDVNLPGTAASTTQPYPQNGWDTYVTALESIAPSITITGQFLGAPDASGVWHNAGYYAYVLKYIDGDFWLTPEVSDGGTSPSQIQGSILLTPYDIEENIFSQVGSVTIYSGTSTDDTVLATVNVGDNTQWGAILAQFLTGFTAGYYGQDGVSPNTQLTGSAGLISLDSNNNWDPNYAFRNETDTVVSSGTGYSFDPYAEAFYEDSNSYGSPYSDALMSQYAAGGPLLTVPDNGTTATTLDLTVYGENEQPTGYTTPTIYDYIAPSNSGYAVPESNNSGANLTFSFYSAVGANAGVSLDPSSAIEIRFLASDTNDTPVWNTVTIDGSGSYTVNGHTFTDIGLWHDWTVIDNAGTWTIEPILDGNNQPIDTNTGALVVTLPTADSGVSWYQVVVGANTSDPKTYNLYTTTATVTAGAILNGATVANGTTVSGVFVNPAYSGQTSAQAVDGLATVSGPVYTTSSEYASTLTVNFATGSTVSYNPDVVVTNTGSLSNLSASGGYSPVLPSAPVVVTNNSGTLSALPGAVISPGTYSTTPTVASTVTAENGALQLGWAGYDTDDVTVQETINVLVKGTITTETITGYGWTGSAAVEENLPATGTLISYGSITNLGTYTDKTNAYDDAVIIVHNASMSQDVTIATTSDDDGNWLTPLYDFGAGTYTLTMYDGIDNNGTYEQVTGASDELVLTVQAGGNGVADNSVVIAPCFAAGTHLATPAGTVAVESLTIGDSVLTADGRAETVQWIGHRSVDCARHPQPEAVWPVRVAAGAFGPGLPLRDLYLSPDHAIFAEGVLIPVKHLINGSSITQEPVAAVTYFHVELTRHEVVLAEGLPVESYLDTGDRASFANAGGAVALHPAWGSEKRDVTLFLEAAGYAPLHVTGPVVARLRDRLAGARNIAA